MFLLGAVGYHLNFGETGKKLSRHFFEKAVSREIERNPDNPSLYSLLGDFYYDRKNYEGALRAYEQSLRLKPENSHVLNNLAWLYATCEDETFRNPEKALELAQKAVALEEVPHILDTLAESYYVNGRFEEAVSAEKRALEQVENDRDHYEEQLRKFMNANHERHEKHEK
jgi:tetratricopeptide (TPR) repeat protein